MISTYDCYRFFGVSAPDTSPIDESLEGLYDGSFQTFAKNSSSVATRYTMQSYVRDGFDLYHVDEACQLARDYLQGCISDYVFLQDVASTNTTDFALYYGDIDFDGDTVFLNDVEGFLFRYKNSSTLDYRTATNGKINFPSLAIVNGSGSSSSTPSHSETFSVSIPVTYAVTSGLSVFRNSIVDESIELDNSGSQSFMYSSFDDTPHLIEGVQNYAVAAFVVCFAVLAFKLADRLFRRVY